MILLSKWYNNNCCSVFPLIGVICEGTSDDTTKDTLATGNVGADRLHRASQNQSAGKSRLRQSAAGMPLRNTPVFRKHHCDLGK
jgi:hypothetical protein